jgi:hypothetical protein
MDRQIAALFGGIVAVGLGPAVWLGGTLFRSEPAPLPPLPAMTGQRTAEVSPHWTSDPPASEPAGSSGGGAEPDLPAGPKPAPTPYVTRTRATPGASVAPPGPPTTSPASVAPPVPPTTSPASPSPTAKPSPEVTPTCPPGGCFPIGGRGRVPVRE